MGEGVLVKPKGKSRWFYLVSLLLCHCFIPSWLGSSLVPLAQLIKPTQTQNYRLKRFMASAEAGPSRSKTPSTPPPTVNRRRSWFSFGSPIHPTSSPTRLEKSSRRPSQTVDEEVELMAVQPSVYVGTAGEENSGRGEELLTIDGHVEETVRRRKSRRGHDESAEGEALRMDDLPNRLSTSESSGGLMRRLAPDPGGTVGTVSSTPICSQLLLAHLVNPRQAHLTTPPQIPANATRSLRPPTTKSVRPNLCRSDLPLPLSLPQRLFAHSHPPFSSTPPLLLVLLCLLTNPNLQPPSKDPFLLFRV